MFRWLLWLAVILLALASAGFVFGSSFLEDQLNKVEPHAPYKISDRTKALHQTLNLADLHADTLLWGRDLLARGTRGHVDVPRLVEGRFALQVFSTVTKSPRGQNYDHNKDDSDSITLLATINGWPPRTWGSLLERALFQAERLDQAARRSPNALMVLHTRADLERLIALRAQGSSIVGGILETEGAHPLEGKIENVQRLFDAGFRMIGLQHFFDNELGGSLHGASKGGLSPFGYQAVRAIEDLGMVVDVAHSSEKVVDDVLQVATKPIVVSHTGVKGTCDSPRNLTDDRMRAIALKGGLIGIGYWEGAVCDYTPKGIAKALRYAVDLVGVDHVAFGSDYDGTTNVKFDASESAALIQAMLDAGFTDEEVRKVSGENTLRFFLGRLPQ